MFSFYRHPPRYPREYYSNILAKHRLAILKINQSSEAHIRAANITNRLFRPRAAGHGWYNPVAFISGAVRRGMAEQFFAEIRGRIFEKIIVRDAALLDEFLQQRRAFA